MVESGCQVAVDFNHRQWKGLPADGDSQPKIERKDVVERSRQSDRQLFQEMDQMLSDSISNWDNKVYVFNLNLKMCIIHI